MARISIGLSGYSYKAWQGPTRFYPPDIKAAGFLRYYATRYPTVELDGIWYRLPTDNAVRNWINETPPDFIYAPKAHREITHVRRLKPEGLPTLKAMLDRLTPLHKAGKLGPVLLQLPPNFKRDDERLAAFLGALPTAYRWAMEFRHDSWHAEPVEQLLRDHGVAWGLSMRLATGRTAMCIVNMKTKDRPGYGPTSSCGCFDWHGKSGEAFPWARMS